MSIFLTAKVPASLRTYAKSCQLANVAPEPYDAWLIRTEATRLNEPIKCNAIYSLDRLTLGCVNGPRWIVSEKTVTVKCILPKGTKVVAPRVVLKVEQIHPFECYAHAISCWTAPPAQLLLGMPKTNWLQLGFFDLPPSLDGQIGEMNCLDAPRTEPLADVTVTGEDIGFSIWHLIALGLFDDGSMDEFLASLHEVPLEALIQDLKEAMSGLQPYYVTELHKFDIPGLGIDELLAVTAFRTPFELCTLFSRPFLSQYDFKEPLVPILQKFVEQTTAKIEEAENE
jgi:hypothetical protein